MGATKIMVIRHAEKPGSYNGVQYAGVNNLGTLAGDDGAKHLVTLGWERAGALVTLFAAPWGPKTPSLATPQFLFASDPIAKHDDDTSDEGPSQRPYETLTALAAKLSLSIDTSHGKNHYAKMVKSALACEGVVLIAWQHEDIALTAKTGGPGISQEILAQTETTGTFNIPTSWPTGPAGARYDLVFVFDRPSGSGPITGFTLAPSNCWRVTFRNIRGRTIPPAPSLVLGSNGLRPTSHRCRIRHAQRTNIRSAGPPLHAGREVTRAAAGKAWQTDRRRRSRQSRPPRARVCIARRRTARAIGTRRRRSPSRDRRRSRPGDQRPPGVAQGRPRHHRQRHGADGADGERMQSNEWRQPLQHFVEAEQTEP